MQGTPEIIIGGNAINGVDGTLIWRADQVNSGGTLGQGSTGGIGPLSYAVDLDLDGQLEVIAGNTVYDGGGNVLWNVRNSQGSIVADGLTAVGNFDDDEFGEVAVVSSGNVYLIDEDGDFIWSAQLPGGGRGGAPTISDVDGDGDPEIGVAGASKYVVFETDGSVKWDANISDFTSAVTGSSVFDFEGDGNAEIIYADEFTLRVYAGSDGSVLYEVPKGSRTAYEMPVVADVDNDGNAEIVFVANDYDSRYAPCRGLPEGTPCLARGIGVVGDLNDTWVSTRSIWNQNAYHVTNVNDDGTIPVEFSPSWTDNNTFRLNTFSDFSGGNPFLAPDLSPSFLRSDVDGDNVELTVRVGNGGSAIAPVGTNVAFYDGNPADGGSLLATTSTSTALAAGQFEDVSLTVAIADVNDLWIVVDDDGTGAGRVTECDELNNIWNPAIDSSFANAAPEFESAPATSASEGIEYRYEFSATDVDGDDLTFSLVNAPEGLIIGDDNSLVWTPTASQSGTHLVQLVATDPTGASALQSFEIDVENLINTRPENVSAAPEIAEVGQPFRYEIKAVDDEGDELTYSLLDSPQFMRVNSTLGIITWIPLRDQLGRNSVLVQVEDSSGATNVQAFDLIVVEPNLTPVFVSEPNPIAVVGSEYYYTVEIFDGNAGDSVQLTLEEFHPDMQFDSDLGILRWTPAEEVADQVVRIRATDEGGATAVQEFTISAVTEAPNAAPEIVSTPGTTIRSGTFYAYAVQVEQADGDSLAWSLAQAPDGMTIDESGVVLWENVPVEPADYEVTVRVEDSRGAFDEQTFTLSVVANNVNTAPVIVSSPAEYARVDGLFAYDMAAVDAEGDQVLWQIVDGPGGAAIDAQTGMLRWIPSLDQVGVREFVIQAIDILGAASTQTFSLQVTCVNHVPVIDSVPGTEATTGRPYFYAVRATDPEGQPLTWELVSAPDEMTIDAETGLIRWVPAPEFAGTAAPIVVKVTDPEGGFATQQFEIQVADGSVAENGNSAPVITSTPVFAAEVDAGYLYDVEAVDADGDNVTYGLAIAPDGMDIDAITGQITWLPDVDDVTGAPIVVAVTATDSNGAVATQGFSIDLRENAPPEISSTPRLTTTAGATYRYTVNASDPVGDDLSYELVTAPEGMTIDSFGRIIWQTPAELAAGTMLDVEALVSDPRGATATQSFTIEVEADTQAPNVGVNALIGSITYVNNAQIDVGNDFTVKVAASDNVGVTSIELYVGGQMVPMNANGEAVISTSAIGSLEILGVAFDAAGNRGESELTVAVVNPGGKRVPTDPDAPPVGPFDPNDENRPEVTITNPEILPPAPGVEQIQTFTTIFDITGTVDDPEDNLWYYDVLFARSDLIDLNNLDQNDPDWIRLARGTEEVFDGKLAEFDPTMLENAQYVIAVVAFDNNANGWIEPTLVNIEGNLKVGNFTFEVTDLSVSLAGIPITVSRVYDTMGANFESDFGYGWTMGIQDGEIFEAGALGVGGAFNPGNTFIPDQTKVYLTDPGGNRVGFTYREELVSASFFGGIFRPYFEADPGVYSTLTIDETQVARGGLIGSLAGGINPDNYTLTTKEGIQYRYNQETGLQKITDLNDNTLTFTDDAITHSSGESIQLIRDSRGRITSIIDPAGNTLTYAYDLNGDLVSFTDQAGLTTTYTYFDAPEHFFESAVKPNGEIALVARYKEDTNEFLGVFDANGNQVDQQDFDVLQNFGVVRDANGNATELIYDNRGNVLTETDPFGNTTTYEYGDPNNPDLETRIVDREGNVTERQYDSRGNLLRIDELGGPNTPTDPVVTEFSYDAGNRVDSITNSDGQTTLFEYDSSGNLTLITNALGDTSSFTYDEQGRRTSFVDFNGNETTFDYEGGDQPSRVTFADGAYQRFEYNQFGQVTFEGFYEADGSLAEVSRTVYDDIGRVIEETTGEGADQTMVRRFYDGQLLDWEVIVSPESLDGSGNLLESPDTPVDDRKSRITDYEYDANDNLISQTDAEGGTVHFRYDLQGNRVALMDPVGNITTWLYDDLNRVVEERDPLYWDDLKQDPLFTGLSDLEYLNLIAPVIQDPAGDPLYDDNIGTDIANNVTADHVTLTAYDSEGNRAKVIDRNGRRLEFTYDFAGRLLTENWYSASGDFVDQLEFSYDSLGNMLAANDLNITGSDSESYLTFAYDALNRLSSVDNAGTPGVPNVVLTYQYDAQGNVIQTQDNFGVTVDSEYDARNQLSVRNWYDADGSGDVDDARVEMSYSAAGRMTEMLRFANVTGDISNLIGKTIRTYDTVGRSDQLNHLDGSDSNISSYDYDYDFAGLVTNETRVHQMTEFSQDIVYGYDLTGQLISADYSGQPNESFSYDPNGNRESSNAHGSDYQTESGNRLTTDGQYTYEYDGEGNLILKTKLQTDDEGQAGETTEYVYDHRNRLIAATIKSAGGIMLDEVSYIYDALGRRIARIENSKRLDFVYDGGNVWIDFDDGTAVVRYLFGNNIDQNISRYRISGGTVWYLTDRLLTVRDLADRRGVLVNHTQFGAFGQILSNSNETSSDRFSFTGREFDSVIEEYYFRARFLRPETGRFLQQDPIGFDSGVLNLSVFVSNSPINFTDPTGNFLVFVARSLIIGASIGLFAGTAVGFTVGYVCEDSLGRLQERVLASALIGTGLGGFVGASFGVISTALFLANPAAAISRGASAGSIARANIRFKTITGTAAAGATAFGTVFIDELEAALDLVQQQADIATDC